MRKVLRWIKAALPFVHLAAEELEDLDDNNTGADDQTAAGINYAADILEAVLNKQPIPYPPAELLGATATTAPLPKPEA